MLQKHYWMDLAPNKTHVCHGPFLLCHNLNNCPRYTAVVITSSLLVHCGCSLAPLFNLWDLFLFFFIQAYIRSNTSQLNLQIHNLTYVLQYGSALNFLVSMEHEYIPLQMKFSLYRTSVKPLQVITIDCIYRGYNTDVCPQLSAACLNCYTLVSIESALS